MKKTTKIILTGNLNKQEKQPSKSHRILIIFKTETQLNKIAYYIMKTVSINQFEMKVIKTNNLVLENNKIKSSIDASKIFKEVYNDGGQFLIREYFMVLYLNNNNVVIGTTLLSMGGMTSTIVDIRLLYREAILLGATAIILAHNHPSGKLEPSSSDINLTQKIKEASKFLDIPILDHLIITEESYYSFLDEGIF